MRIRDLRELREGTAGRLSVGSIMAASPGLLTDALLCLKAAYPLLSLVITVDTSDRLLKLLDEGEKPITYQIVGETEADAKGGRISYASPLGRALIGRSRGDEVEVSTPGGDRYYVIDQVQFV